MTFQDRLEGNIVVFELSGKIMTYSECDSLRNKVKEYIASGKISFVVDMADVPWINSEGIGLLASMVATVGRSSGKVVLANTNDKVDKVLDITGCSSVIRRFDSRAAAIGAITGAVAD